MKVAVATVFLFLVLSWRGRIGTNLLGFLFILQATELNYFKDILYRFICSFFVLHKCSFYTVHLIALDFCIFWFQCSQSVLWKVLKNKFIVFCSFIHQYLAIQFIINLEHKETLRYFGLFSCKLPPFKHGSQKPQCDP